MNSTSFAGSTQRPPSSFVWVVYSSSSLTRNPPLNPNYIGANGRRRTRPGRRDLCVHSLVSGFRVSGLRYGVCMGFRDKGLAARIEGLCFGVEGLGFRVEGLGFRVWGVKF